VFRARTREVELRGCYRRKRIPSRPEVRNLTRLRIEEERFARPHWGSTQRCMSTARSGIIRHFVEVTFREPGREAKGKNRTPRQ